MAKWTLGAKYLCVNVSAPHIEDYFVVGQSYTLVRYADYKDWLTFDNGFSAPKSCFRPIDPDPLGLPYYRAYPLLCESMEAAIDRLQKVGWTHSREGNFSTVLINPNSEWVYKIGRPHDGWHEYANLAMTKYKGESFVPRITMLKWCGTLKNRFYIAKIEKLEATIQDSDNELAEKLFNKARAYLMGLEPPKHEPGSINKLVRNRRLGKSDRLKELMEDLTKLPYDHDLHNENAMVRACGDLVITDPLAYFNRKAARSRRKCTISMST